MMIKIALSLLLFVIVGTLGTASGSTRPPAHPAISDVDILQMQLENVRIKARSIEALLTRLSLTHDVPIGLVARSDEQLTTYRIDFKRGSLSDLLTQFTNTYQQYTWKVENGVVNVLPVGDFRDPLIDEVLTTEISSFSVKERTSCSSFINALISTPEIGRLLERNNATFAGGYPGGFYIPQLGQRFAAEFSGMQAKSILDKVIRESPVAKFWIIQRDRSTQALLLNVKARVEDLKKPRVD